MLTQSDILYQALPEWTHYRLERGGGAGVWGVVSVVNISAFIRYAGTAIICSRQHKHSELLGWNFCDSIRWYSVARTRSAPTSIVTGKPRRFIHTRQEQFWLCLLSFFFLEQGHRKCIQKTSYSLSFFFCLLTESTEAGLLGMVKEGSNTVWHIRSGPKQWQQDFHFFSLFFSL